MTKREYRGARFEIFIFWKKKISSPFFSRQVDAFMDFLRKNVQSSLIKLSTPSDLVTLDEKKRYIIGHFDDDKSENYQTFSKIAGLMRDECNFAVSANK